MLVCLCIATLPKSLCRNTCVGFTTIAAVILIIHVTLLSNSTADDVILVSSEQNKTLPSPDNKFTPTVSNSNKTLRR